jgi:hypothetical protein
MFWKYGYIVCITGIILFFHCFPVDAPLKDTLNEPELEFVGMAAVSDGQGGYTEAVHLHWTFAKTDATPLQSFTLLRQLTGDSVIDVFSGSRLIPPDTGDFFDELVNYTFPSHTIDSIIYRIMAVDTFGREGDTSDPCIAYIAPQPAFIAADAATGCYSWESWIRGGIFSWCRIWRDGESVDWTSSQLLEFPLTDKSATFNACLPDTLLPCSSGRWYYALFIKASESRSLKTGVIDVP